MLRRDLGKLKFVDLGRERLIEFGRDRAAAGAGPVTISMDIGAIRLVMSHVAAVHGIPVKIEPIDLARIALKRLGLVGKSNERDRRPTDEELEALFAHVDANEPDDPDEPQHPIRHRHGHAPGGDLPGHLERLQRPHQDADDP